MLNMRNLWTITAAGALATSSPVAAQFEITYPDEPPKEGETLLEWADPPILKHTIPETERGDTSTCGATSEYALEQTAVACWPVLRATQLFLLADYTAVEPTGDKSANRRKAIALADDAIAYIGTPEWPLEEYLLIKSLELKLNSLMRLEEWDAAYDTSVQLVSAIQNDLFEFDEFRLSFAYRKQGQVFLKLGMYDGAKLILEDARKLLSGFDADNNAMAFSDQSEDIIVHAINKGDIPYAVHMSHMYLTHIRRTPRGLRFGQNQHIDLLLYIAATQGKVAPALQLLDERFENQRSYAECDKGYFQFPRVLGPLLDDAAIREKLAEGGCSEDRFTTSLSEPIKALDGKTLPPFE